MPNQDPNLAQPLGGLDWLKAKLQEQFQNRAQEFGGPDPTAGVMPMMIPTAANLPKFAQGMREALQQIPAELGYSQPNTAETALEGLKNRLTQAYMQVRYPRQMSIPKQTRFVGAGDLGPGVAGNYSPGFQDINIAREATPIDTTRTIGHEMTHAKDFADRLRASEGVKEVQNYAPYSDYSNYSMNPYEVRARQAGDTTSRGFEDLLNLIGKKDIEGPGYLIQHPGAFARYDPKTFIQVMYDFLNKGR